MNWNLSHDHINGPMKMNGFCFFCSPGSSASVKYDMHTIILTRITDTVYILVITLSTPSFLNQ